MSICDSLGRPGSEEVNWVGQDAGHMTKLVVGLVICKPGNKADGWAGWGLQVSGGLASLVMCQEVKLQVY